MLGASVFAYLLSRAPVDSPSAQARPPQAVRSSLADCTHSQASGFRLSTPAETVMLGDVQRVDLDCSDGRITPDHITASADVPIEMYFRGTIGCLRKITIDGVDIDQISEEGRALSLPGLSPGVYRLKCSQQRVAGLLVVE
jgi:hypothetical protein